MRVCGNYIMKKFLILLYFIAIIAYPSYRSYGQQSYVPLSVLIKSDKNKFSSSEEVIIQIIIKNISDQNVSFKIYDSSGRKDIFDRDRGDISDYTTFKPVLYDTTGKSEKLISPYVVSEHKGSEILPWMQPREIKLAPGEIFIHRQNLGRIYNIEIGKKYRVKMHFFPYLNDPDLSGLVVSSSNEISFSVTKDPAYIPFIAKDPKAVNISPSEIVLLFLNAEREGNRDKAIKYINIDKFIHSYPDFSRKYDLADEEDKKIIENDFIRYLINRKSDYLKEFRITNEEIDNSGLVAFVTVEARRSGLVKESRFKYIYRLEKSSESDFLWLISGLEALVIRDIRR